MYLTLLLNNSYQPLRFIPEKDVFKLLAKEKVDSLAYWEHLIRHGDNGTMKHPSVVKLKLQIKYHPKFVKLNRVQIFKRDQFICQYCGFAGTTAELSIDHIIPQSQKGKTSWLNCTTACKSCNGKKKNRTPEQAEMRLINQPFVYHPTILNEAEEIHLKHFSWYEFIGL